MTPHPARRDRFKRDAPRACGDDPRTETLGKAIHRLCPARAGIARLVVRFGLEILNYLIWFVAYFEHAAEVSQRLRPCLCWLACCCCQVGLGRCRVVPVFLMSVEPSDKMY